MRKVFSILSLLLLLLLQGCRDEYIATIKVTNNSDQKIAYYALLKPEEFDLNTLSYPILLEILEPKSTMEFLPLYKRDKLIRSSYKWNVWVFKTKPTDKMCEKCHEPAILKYDKTTYDKKYVLSYDDLEAMDFNIVYEGD